MIWWLGYSQYGSPRKRALVKDGPTSATSGCCPGFAPKRALVKDGPTSATSGCCPGFAPPGSYVCVRIGGEKVSV